MECVAQSVGVKEEEEEEEHVFQTAELVPCDDIKEAIKMERIDKDEPCDRLLSDQRDDIELESTAQSTGTNSPTNTSDEEEDLITKGTVKRLYPIRNKLNYSRDCTRCDFKSNSIYRLRNHYKTLHSSQLYPCSECCKMFHYKGNLKDHKRFYHSDGSEVFSCSQCEFTSNSFAVLSTHKQHNHYHTEILSCGECSFTTRYKKSMTNHQMSKHSEVSRYVCKVCQKTFSFKNSLVKHQRTHTGERPFSCDLCEYSAMTSSVLTTHVRRNHTDPRPFQCRNCKLKFVDKKSLKEHLAVHMQECVVCSFKTTSKTEINKHNKICHRKEYHCTFCLFKTCEHGDLVCHLKDKHDIVLSKEASDALKPHQCVKCLRRFAQKGGLKHHMNFCKSEVISSEKN